MYKLAIVAILVLIMAGCSVWASKNTDDPKVDGNIDKTPIAAQKSISWLPAVVAVSVVLVGVSVALLFAGNKLGMVGLAGSGTALVVAITVARFLWLIAAIGGLVALGLAALLVWKIWENRKALTEVVWTAEEAKKMLTETTREMLFGGMHDSGTAGEMQSPATEKLVAKIRANSG